MIVPVTVTHSSLVIVSLVCVERVCADAIGAINAQHARVMIVFFMMMIPPRLKLMVSVIRQLLKFAVQRVCHD